MSPEQEVKYMVQDCLFAIGQTVGREARPDHQAIAWWRSRYAQKFLHAMAAHGASWAEDRRQVTAVARFLGLRAADYADDGIIDRDCAERASREVELGCQMHARSVDGSRSVRSVQLEPCVDAV